MSASRWSERRRIPGARFTTSRSLLLLSLLLLLSSPLVLSIERLTKSDVCWACSCCRESAMRWSRERQTKGDRGEPTTSMESVGTSAFLRRTMRRDEKCSLNCIAFASAASDACETVVVWLDALVVVRRDGESGMWKPMLALGV